MKNRESKTGEIITKQGEGEVARKTREEQKRTRKGGTFLRSAKKGGGGI